MPDVASDLLTGVAGILSSAALFLASVTAAVKVFRGDRDDQDDGGPGGEAAERAELQARLDELEHRREKRRHRHSAHFTACGVT